MIFLRITSETPLFHKSAHLVRTIFLAATLFWTHAASGLMENDFFEIVMDLERIAQNENNPRQIRQENLAAMLNILQGINKGEKVHGHPPLLEQLRTQANQALNKIRRHFMRIPDLRPYRNFLLNDFSRGQIVAGPGVQYSEAEMRMFTPQSPQVVRPDPHSLPAPAPGQTAHSMGIPPVPNQHQQQAHPYPDSANAMEEQDLQELHSTQIYGAPAHAFLDAERLSNASSRSSSEHSDPDSDLESTHERTDVQAQAWQITPEQRHRLDALRAHALRHNRPPTAAEIANAVSTARNSEGPSYREHAHQDPAHRGPPSYQEGSTQTAGRRTPQSPAHAQRHRSTSPPPPYAP